MAPTHKRASEGASAAAGNAAAWDRWHRERDQLEQLDQLPGTAVWRDLAIAQLQDLEGKRVLDCGCARGGFDRLLADRGAVVTAVDISGVAVELTRRQLDGRGRVIQADGLDLPFDDDSFDIAICLQTLNHVRQRDQLLTELVRVTRPSGQIVVTVSNILSPLWLSRQALRIALRRSTEVPPEEHGATIPGVTRSLRRHNVRIERVTGDAHAVVIPGHGTVGLDWLGRLPGARLVAFHACISGIVGVLPL